ncbi:MAG: hypothetical protein WAQ57_00440 [Candidatus Saccharimonadales bacterium]
MKVVLAWLNRYKSWFALTLAGLLLLLAQSAYWVNHTLFDQVTFIGIVEDTVKTEKSRRAVAETIVNRALQDRPVLRRTISAKSTQLVTGLLGTDLAAQTFDTLINHTYAYFTSSNPQPIAMDLTSIKTPLAGLISFAEQQGREVQFDPAVIPDSIILFDSAGLPDVHGYSVKLLWLGPVFWLGTAGLFAAYIYRGRRAYAKRAYIVGIVIIISAVTGLLTGPLLPPPLAAQVPILEMRGVVGDLIRGLLQPFMTQMIVTIALTAGTLLIFSQRYNALKLAQRFAGKYKAQPAARSKTVNK